MGQIKKLWGQIFFHSGCYLLIMIGVLLRAKHLLENRSLWVDEAITAVGVTSLSFKDILLQHEVYPNFAKSPLFFKLISKSMVSLFGSSELVFRVFPFIFGVLAIFLFYLLLKKTSSTGVVFTGLILFCVNSDLIYYSAELRQYSGDVALAVAFMLGWEFLRERGYPVKGIWGLGFGASLGVWLSYSVIFVMGAVGIVSMTEVLSGKKYKKIKALACAGVVFIASAVFLYILVLSKMEGNEVVVETWEGLRQGLPLFSLSTLVWIRNIWNKAFIHPLLLDNNFIVQGLWLLGFISVMKTDRIRAGAYSGPILLTFLAALCAKYPFHKRLILFLVPFYYFFIAKGLNVLFEHKRILIKYTGILIFLFILINPLKQTWSSFQKGYEQQQNRELFDFVNENYIPGESIFLNTSAQYPFLYYIRQNGLLGKLPGQFVYLEDVHQSLYCSRVTQIAMGIKEFEGAPYIAYRNVFIGFDKQGLFKLWFISHSDTERHYLFDGDPFPKDNMKRAWVIFISYNEDIRRIFLDSMDLSGTKIKALELKGVSAYLYQFD